MTLSLEESLVGSLLGTAVGDSVGLCCEGLSRTRQQRLFPQLTGPQFLFGQGMISDDTEHACLVVQSIILSNGDVEVFSKNLARKMRVWFLGMTAGIGWATLKSCVRLCLGFSARRSGVFSAGNGPAMRSPILGLCFGNDHDKLRQFIRVSTRITHTDPKAEYGALAVAWAAYVASQRLPEHFLCQIYYQGLEALLGSDASDAHELTDLVRKVIASVEVRQSTQNFASELGLDSGISGYMYHTVPLVLHCWFRHPGDLRSAILEIVHCGGDTDTTAAILGGIIGAGVGKKGIPKDWLKSILEWPKSINWIEELGRRLGKTMTTGECQPVPTMFWPAILIRNLFFTGMVLAHGFRRLLPPY